MSIDKNIRKLRKALGLTQAQLAEQIGTRQKVIADYENNTSKPPRDRLLALSKFFNLSVEELIGDKINDGSQTDVIAHGNSRTAKLINAYQKLPAGEQRLILKQTEALANTQQPSKDTSNNE